MTREDKWRLAQWTVISAQAGTATLFGLKLLAQWGTDFGVYFVGGMSISDEYGLYTGFFDHKGPLYYAFIRLLSAVVPYSPIGAVVVLGVTCAIWFASIGIGLRMLHLSKPVKVIVGFGAIAALANQASNASIALFGASFVFATLVSMLKFAETGKRVWCSTSFALLGLAVLTRIDALVMLPLIFVIGIGPIRPTKARTLIVTTSLAGAVIFMFTLLLICSRLLGFGLEQYWEQGVLFNLTVYPEWYGTGSPAAHILSAGYLGQSLMSTGLLSVWILILFFGWSQLPIDRRFTALMLVLYASAVFVATGSGKEYHLFIVYPGLLLSLAIAIPPVTKAWNKGIVAASLVVLALSSCLIVGKLFWDSRCVFKGIDNCPNQYLSLVAEVQRTGAENNEFFGNQGWPFLMMGRKATVSFTPLFPLAVDLGEATRKVLMDSSKARNKVIWIYEGDLAISRGFPENSVKEFLQGRQPIGESISGFTRMSPAAGN